MILSKAIQLFLNQHIPTSAESYKWPLRDMAGHLGERRLITEIGIEDMYRYEQNIKQRDYAPKTVLKYLKDVKVFFNWLVKQDLLRESPARFIHVRKSPLKNVEKMKAMTDEELAKILDFAKYKPRDYALVLFLADTAARAGEAANLKVSDLDLENKRATIIGKAHEYRVVAFEEKCHKALVAWLAKRDSEAGEYVFAKNGKHLQAASISQIITRLCERVGIRLLGSHSLRHRKGYQLSAKKVPAPLAARVMGHKHFSITMEYYYPQGWEDTEKVFRELATD